MEDPHFVYSSKLFFISYSLPDVYHSNQNILEILLSSLNSAIRLINTKVLFAKLLSISYIVWRFVSTFYIFRMFIFEWFHIIPVCATSLKHGNQWTKTLSSLNSGNLIQLRSFSKLNLNPPFQRYFHNATGCRLPTR